MTAVETFVQSYYDQLDSLSSLVGAYINNQKKVNQGHQERAANMLAAQRQASQVIVALVFETFYKLETWFKEEKVLLQKILNRLTFQP